LASERGDIETDRSLPLVWQKEVRVLTKSESLLMVNLKCKISQEGEQVLPRGGGGGGVCDPILYTHVSTCKNDKLKFKNNSLKLKNQNKVQNIKELLTVYLYFLRIYEKEIVYYL
jgi:hypothetical protein